MPADTQAECLLGLARAESLHLVARSVAITAFDASRGYEADGQYSPRTWLQWQTRSTRHACLAAVGWARRLTAHPAVQAALAAGEISVSWAQQVCAWTDRLPEEARGDADAILLAEAARGADLERLAGLAEELFRLTAPPDTDDGKDFTDRSLALDLTFGGAGRLVADLTPECAAAVQAMLESLGKKAGPRTPGRCRSATMMPWRRRAGGWPAAAGCPDRAGQPTQIQYHLTLDQLLGRDTTTTSRPGTARRQPPAPARGQRGLGGRPGHRRR